MLRATTAQKFTSTKIYDLLIGLGAEKKRAEIAIGEFVDLVPKALASSAAETGLDTTLPTDKGDIWRLEAIISENKNDTDLKLKDIESEIVETKSDLIRIITDNKNETDLKLKDIESKIVETKSNLEKIITKNRNDLEKIITDNKNDLEKIITDNKNETDLKLKDIESKIVETKSDLIRIITDNKNETDLKLKDIESKIVDSNNATDLKIERMRTEAEKHKNALLIIGISTQLAVGGLVVAVLQLLKVLS